jgi:hypothetical protein
MNAFRAKTVEELIARTLDADWLLSPARVVSG